MASVSLNFTAGVEDGTTGQGAEVFSGFGSQNRVDIASTGAFSATPNATIAAGTAYVEVVTDAKIKVYAGPTSNNDTVKQAIALVLSSDRVFEVDAGDVVHIWTY